MCVPGSRSQNLQNPSTFASDPDPNARSPMYLVWIRVRVDIIRDQVDRLLEVPES